MREYNILSETSHKYAVHYKSFTKHKESPSAGNVLEMLRGWLIK